MKRVFASLLVVTILLTSVGTVFAFDSKVIDIITNEQKVVDPISGSRLKPVNTAPKNPRPIGNINKPAKPKPEPVQPAQPIQPEPEPVEYAKYINPNKVYQSKQ